MVNKKHSEVSPTFSKKLKLLRQQREWSQGQVAMKIGVDAQRISKYERGVLYPTTDLAVKLADLFDVSLDYLLRDENHSAPGMTNPELVKKMREVDQLPEDKQHTILALLEAFIKQHKFEELVRS